MDKRFGWGLMGYWGGILVLGMMAKLMGSVSSQRRAPSCRDAEPNIALQSMHRKQTKPKAMTSVLHYLRTYFVVPASFAPILPHHQQLYYWHTVPRRLDLLIVLGFWALCIILACVDYQSFSGNIEYYLPSSEKIQSPLANRYLIGCQACSSRTGNTHPTVRVFCRMLVFPFCGYLPGVTISFFGRQTSAYSRSISSIVMWRGPVLSLRSFILSTIALCLHTMVSDILIIGQYLLIRVCL